jgi:Flp pilus assembly protein TadD
MTEDSMDQAFALMQDQRFAEAMPLLLVTVGEDPTNWNAWYLAGQCYRFLEDFDGAVENHTRAVELAPNEAPVRLALGIALQQQGNYQDAKAQLRRAIEIDPDCDPAFNSLAMTQKMSGELELALKNYDAGIKVLTRRIVKAMRNDRANPILKHRDTIGTLWTEYVTYGAMFLASNERDLQGVAWMTGDQAMEEERTEAHGGLYWVDTPNEKQETVRLYLPNYFNTFREMLRSDSSYANMTGNQGTVLEMLGREKEARQYFAEANEFLP